VDDLIDDRKGHIIFGGKVMKKSANREVGFGGYLAVCSYQSICNMNTYPDIKNRGENDDPDRKDDRNALSHAQWQG
jgi:hypothetical protein